MSIHITVHKTHREFTGGKDKVEVEGSTVGKCLADLIRQYPDMKERLFDKKGNLLTTMEIYINAESAYPDELAKPVADGDEVHLLVMLAGG